VGSGGAGGEQRRRRCDGAAHRRRSLCRRLPGVALGRELLLFSLKLL